jgi:hypothetical protein
VKKGQLLLWQIRKRKMNKARREIRDRFIFLSSLLGRPRLRRISPWPMVPASSTTNKEINGVGVD